MIKLTARERLSSDRAEELITEWIDKTVRRPCLAILAGSIKKLGQTTPSAWAVTLCPNGQPSVRLTVGMVDVYDVQRDEIALTLHGPSQDAAVLALYLRGDNHAALRWFTSDGSAPRTYPPQFPSLPAAIACRFRARDIEAVWPLVRESYMRMLALAAEKPLSPAVRRSHSPGVIEYIHAAFSEGLPVL